MDNGHNLWNKSFPNWHEDLHTKQWFQGHGQVIIYGMSLPIHDLDTRVWPTQFWILEHLFLAMCSIEWSHCFLGFFNFRLNFVKWNENWQCPTLPSSLKFADIKICQFLCWIHNPFFKYMYEYETFAVEYKNHFSNMINCSHSVATQIVREHFCEYITKQQNMWGYTFLDTTAKCHKECLSTKQTNLVLHKTIIQYAFAWGLTNSKIIT